MICSITKMDNKTTQRKNYDIDIIKNDNNVIITCLDKIMHKLYKESFTNEYTRNVLLINNLDNFFNIVNDSFKNNTFTVVLDHDNILINIMYNAHLVFNFELRLPLTDNAQLNANSVYINKLERRIEELEQLAWICVGNSDQSNIIVPVYFDLLVVKNESCELRMPNKQNKYSIMGKRYDYDTKTLTIALGYNHSYCVMLNSNFLLLKPKKITFFEIPPDQIDYSCFPKER